MVIQKCVACLVLIALLLAGCSRSGAEEFTPNEMSTGVLDIDTMNLERTFTFSADPAVAVLQLHWSGGLRMDTVEYSLSGDGRCRKVRRSGGALFTRAKKWSCRMAKPRLSYGWPSTAG